MKGAIEMTEILFPAGHIFAGTLSISANKSVNTQTTLPDSTYVFGREYCRETPPQISYNIAYDCVNKTFVDSVINAIKTYGGNYTAYYYYSDSNSANTETAEITGFIQSASFNQIKGSKYFTGQITIKDNSYIARIGD